jgi:N6-adenosine-specific RNA methylase IME4
LFLWASDPLLPVAMELIVAWGFDVRRLIVEERRERSRKPDRARERIERLVAGPYLELFARETKQGWDCWGEQVHMFDRPVSLCPSGARGCAR